LASLRQPPNDRSTWAADRTDKQSKLIELLGGFPTAEALQLKWESDPEGRGQTLTFDAETDLTTFARRDSPVKATRLVILLDLESGADRAWKSDWAAELRNDGWSVVVPELRATGRFTVPRDKIGHAEDHNSAEWAMWIGRPLVGQWVVDIRRTLDAIAEQDGSLPNEIMIAGRGSSAVVALFAGALDERISRVKAVDLLSSYVSDQPYRGIRLGLMIPGILRDFGDVSDLASLIAPRSLTILGGTTGVGTALDRSNLVAEFSVTQRAFELLGVPDSLVIQAGR